MLDNFGSLFYVDKDLNGIYKIIWEQLDSIMKNHKPIEQGEHIYSRNTTVTINSLECIHIDEEYIYWTNTNNGTVYGPVHKAFTTPFVKAVPF